MNERGQGARTSDQILSDINPVVKQVLRNSGYSDEQIAQRILNAETPGHKEYGNYFDMTADNIRGAHLTFVNAGTKYKDDPTNTSKGDKLLEQAGPLGTREELTNQQIIDYANLFPTGVTSATPLQAKKEMFELIQQYYSVSNPDKPQSKTDRSPYNLRKKITTVGIVVPGRKWNRGGEGKEELARQIALANDYLETVGADTGFNPKIIYSNDSRLQGKVHLMPLNKKNQPMFSHWDKGINWESGLSIGGETAAMSGVTYGALKVVPEIGKREIKKTPAALLIAAGAYGGSTAGNKMFNHDVFGMARDFQIPNALNLGFQELLKEDSSIEFIPKGDVYDILNDPVRIMLNRKELNKYYDSVVAGQEMTFKTSAFGYGSKPAVSQGTIDSIFDFMEQSNKMYSKLGGKDPVKIKHEMEKKQRELEQEQQKQQQKKDEEDTKKMQQQIQQKQPQPQSAEEIRLKRRLKEYLAPGAFL